MSDRPYSAQEFYPAHQASLEDKKRLAYMVRRGLILGVPSANNPLGLYQFVPDFLGGNAKRRCLVEFAEPYDKPDQNTIDTCSLFEDSLDPSTYDFAASLVFGGLIRYAQQRKDMTPYDIQVLNDTEMLNFTTALTFRLLRNTARCAILHLGVTSMDELRKVCLDSYEGQVGVLTRMRSNEAQSTEYQVGVSVRPDQFVDTQASLGVDHNSSTVRLSVDPIFVGPRTRCSGAVDNNKGESYAKSMWARGVSVCCALPWLFEAEFDRS